MTYRVNCSIRNARGKEIAHRTPLWSGVANDPKAAMLHGWAALKPIVDATAEADTIVIDVHGPKGLRVTATEYAEDFRIGYGASAVGSSALFADELGVSDMTEEQKAEAMKAFQARSVATLRPGLTPRTQSQDLAKPGEDYTVRQIWIDGKPVYQQERGELDRILKEFGAEIKDVSAPAINEEWQLKRQRQSVSWLIRDQILNANQTNKKIQEVLCSMSEFHNLANELGMSLDALRPAPQLHMVFAGIPVYPYSMLPEGDVKFIMEAQ